MKRLSLFLLAVFLALPQAGFAQGAAGFAAPAAVGERVERAPYTVEKLAEGVFHIQDAVAAYPAGIWLNEDGAYAYDENGAYMNNTAEMYLIVGGERALLIDLSNAIERDDAPTALVEICRELCGGLPMEIAISHGHGDHMGMAPAFPDATIYFPEGDYSPSMGERYGLTAERVRFFTPGRIGFDLGGRLVETVHVGGHTADSTAFFLDGENIGFTSDAIGSGSGVWIWGEAGLENFLGGMENLMNYLKGYREEDLAALRIYGGHAWQYGKFVAGGADHLNWQYVQDMARCIALAKEGAWFRADSGLACALWDAPMSGLDCDLIYGTAAISVAYAAACDFAGYTESGVRRADYAWGADLGEADVVGSGGSAAQGAYLNLFDERRYADEAVGEMTYYVYDPIAHGADPEGVYPVLFYLHGSGNALEGKSAITYAGAEPFASPEYQAAMGGAYVVCPLANETADESGRTLGNWMTQTADGTTSAYSAALKGILDEVLAQNAGHTGKVIGAGTSAGGYGMWRFIIDWTEDVDACLLMAAAYTPTEEELNKIEASGMRLWVTHGLRDELARYEKTLEPIVSRLLAMPNAEVTVLDWVRNGDGSIATVNFGVEMGQHCICTQIGQNLIYDDGRPYDISHPRGVTGWVYDVAHAGEF